MIVIETETAWELLCELYTMLQLYINFFQPSVKLIDKVRKGHRVTKKYDLAKTPYQRVLSSEHISQTIKN